MMTARQQRRLQQKLARKVAKHAFKASQLREEPPRTAALSHVKLLANRANA